MQASSAEPSGDVTSLLDSLARFATTLDLQRVPDSVRRQAGLCVLDTIGCMLAGADTPEGTLA